MHAFLSCLSRLCCSRTLAVHTLSDDEIWDIRSAAAGSWLDPTIIDKAYDKVIISLGTGAQGQDVRVEVVGGGCSDSSKWTFFGGKQGCTVLLLYKRGNSCVELLVSAGCKEEKLRLPAAEAGLTSASVLGVQLSLRVELAEVKHATQEQYRALGLKRHDILIPPQQRDAAPGGERAVLTYKRHPGNKSMVLWLPGRNDCFYHPHVLPQLLEAGFDFYAIDHRRNGLAQEGASQRVKKITSHIDDCRRYLFEWDEAMAFALEQVPYEKVVLYGHSTGGLEAWLFLREAKERHRVSHCILNSPFLDWGEGGIAEVVLDNMGTTFSVIELLKGTEEAELFAMQVPTEPSSYGVPMGSQYPRNPQYHNVVDNLVTAGWSRAVTRLQQELVKGPPSEVPTLLLHTPGDRVLDGDELGTLGHRFSHNCKAVEVMDCRHDMLLNHKPEKNAEVLGIMLGFLGAGESTANLY